MEVMEEGNLMDRVPILLQRDLQFYEEHQRVLQETICSGVVGGKLDFPRYASFAAVKIVTWWEEEYFAAYRKNSGLLHIHDYGENSSESAIVKNSDPEKFVVIVTKSADLLLTHIHNLSQESLDHADLSVLTATIGAAALVRNCLKIYLKAATVVMYPPKGDDPGCSLKLTCKQYSNMAEALAERLMDLHCRLLLLYVVQDADCLYFEDDQPFYESERGSYTIQMWWHYIKGTREDLWNSVPPKMAKRIFEGMVNETLSVLTMRYSHIITNPARAQLHLVDICNLLHCMAALLPSMSDSGEAYLGLQLNKQGIITRDVHAKCQDLFYCLLLRGAPLGILTKCFRKGLDGMELFSSRKGLPSAWIIFTLPKYFPNDNTCQWISDFSDLATNAAIALELKVMLAAPAPSWSFLIKVLLMRDSTILAMVLHHLIKYLPSCENFKNVIQHPFTGPTSYTKCDAFMCRGDCFNIMEALCTEDDPVGQSNSLVVLALTYIVVCVGSPENIETGLIKSLEKNGGANWSDCLDKKQIWNQKRPPWLEALAYFLYPVTDAIVEVLIHDVESGYSMYQSMGAVIASITEMWICIPKGLYKVAMLLQEVIPVTTKPISGSVLLQIILMSIYTELMKAAERFEKGSHPDYTKAAICYSLSESICSIDEDDKHTEQINSFLNQARDSLDGPQGLDVLFGERDDFVDGDSAGRGRSGLSTAKIDDLENEANGSEASSTPTNSNIEKLDVVSEILVSDVLISDVGCQSLKVSFNYLKNNKEWILQQLGVSDLEANKFEAIQGQSIKEDKLKVLSSMFYIDNVPFDQLLTESLQIDYLHWLQTPLSMKKKRCSLHLARRYDFQENAKLSISDLAMVAAISRHLKK